MTLELEEKERTI